MPRAAVINRVRWAGLVLCLALSIGACRRQPASTPGEADRLLEQARAVYEQAGAKTALPLFEAVLARYLADGNRRGEAITLGLIGNCHKRLGDRARALELLGQALEMKRSLGDEPEAAYLDGSTRVLFQPPATDVDFGGFGWAVAATPGSPVVLVTEHGRNIGGVVNAGQVWVYLRQ